MIQSLYIFIFLWHIICISLWLYSGAFRITTSNQILESDFLKSRNANYPKLKKKLEILKKAIKNLEILRDGEIVLYDKNLSAYFIG